MQRVISRRHMISHFRYIVSNCWLFEYGYGTMILASQLEEREA